MLYNCLSPNFLKYLFLALSFKSYICHYFDLYSQPRSTKGSKIEHTMVLIKKNLDLNKGCINILNAVDLWQGIKEQHRPCIFINLTNDCSNFLKQLHVVHYLTTVLCLYRYNFCNYMYKYFLCITACSCICWQTLGIKVRNIFVCF